MTVMTTDHSKAVFASGRMIYGRSGISPPKKVTDAIDKVQKGTDKTAAELALTRLPQELNALKQQRFNKQRLLKKNTMSVGNYN